MALRGQLTPRAISQVFLTVLTLATAVTAFLFSFYFQIYVEQMRGNFRGEIEMKQGASLPCVRHTLDSCDNTQEDQCWARCCPQGYICRRSPIVGLHCEDGTVTCGNYLWCRDFADISDKCQTDPCKSQRRVSRTGSWCYILSAIGVLLDIIDVMIFCVRTLQHNVLLKSTINISSSIVKWIAFGIAIAAGTAQFLSELNASQCYNQDGMHMCTMAAEMFLSYVVLQITSAIFSLVVAPMSAYWGGTLLGMPYVK